MSDKTAEQAQPVAWRRWEDGMWIYYEVNAWPDLEPLYATPSPDPKPVPHAQVASEATRLKSAEVWTEVARLMRYIDAYAYDYGKLGKVAGSRFDVERQLCIALAAQASGPDQAGGTQP